MTVFRHRATGTHTGGGEQWTFGLYSEGTGTVDEAETAWDNGVSAFFTSMGTAIPSTVSVLTTSTASIDETTGAQITRRELANAAAGTGTAESLPFQVTPVVSLRTLLATRAGRGRFYAPSLGVDQISGGRMLPAARTALADAALAMLQQVMISGLVPVIFHRTASSGVAQFSRTQIVSLDVGDVLDTQRRRRNKLIESRESRTL